jgi:preprotein translocase subunit SecE
MAVAEARKMDDDRDTRGGGSGAPAWLAGPLGWGPRKLAELRTFFSEVKSELKKVTWPSRDEVQSTTVVVIITTIFFGFYLYGMDLAFSWLLSFILKK